MPQATPREKLIAAGPAALSLPELLREHATSPVLRLGPQLLGGLTHAGTRGHRLLHPLQRPQLEQPLSDLLLVSELADAESALFHLVNARQGKGRLTILTGNLNEADIYRVYGERTLARICHQGAIVPVKGRDMRRGAQQRSEGGS